MCEKPAQDKVGDHDHLTEFINTEEQLVINVINERKSSNFFPIFSHNFLRRYDNCFIFEILLTEANKRGYDIKQSQ